MMVGDLTNDVGFLLGFAMAPIIVTVCALGRLIFAGWAFFSGITICFGVGFSGTITGVGFAGCMALFLAEVILAPSEVYANRSAWFSSGAIGSTCCSFLALVSLRAFFFG